jgi:hypothetical protein
VPLDLGADRPDDDAAHPNDDAVRRDGDPIGPHGDAEQHRAVAERPIEALLPLNAMLKRPMPTRKRPMPIRKPATSSRKELAAMRIPGTSTPKWFAGGRKTDMEMRQGKK